jgi:DNA-directed RNA polymerase beta subunit
MSSKSTKTNNMGKKILKRPTKEGTDNETTKKPKVSFEGLDGASVIPSDDNLTISDLFRLSDLHFNKKNYMFRHLYDSYNKFIEEDVKNCLEYSDHVFSETLTPTTHYRYRFKYDNVRIEEPMMSNGVEPLFPTDARHNRLTYSVRMFANVTQFQDIVDIASDHKTTEIVGNSIPNYHIGTIPLMVRSKWCSLVNHRDAIRNECEYDPGGYFIVNGNEKVVISQDRMCDNKPLVFIKKDSGAMSYVVQVNSRSYKFNGITQVMNVKLRKDGVMMIRVPILNEVNVCAVLRALGMKSDKQIIDYITYDSHDSDMIDLIRLTLDACKGEKGSKISTQDEAIDFLLPKIRIPKKYTESDKETKQNQKKMHLNDLFQRSFLPHVEGNKIMKAYYLCYMLNRLLRASLGRIPVDDRDSYINKRVDLPGDLMMELFKQQHKKAMGDCKKFFENRNKSDLKPINIISNIKANTIEQGFKASLSTGRWIRRMGVAQMLNRLSYLQTISFLRRVDAPGGDASSQKLTNPRHLHASSVGDLCCVTGDTEILQADGSVKQIKDMKNGDFIASTYKEDFKDIATPIRKFFSRMADNLLEITTATGKKLKCTPDHPILIFNDDCDHVMKNAGDLKEGDKVIMRESPEYIASLYTDKEYFDKYVNKNYVAIPIKSIIRINPEMVYDFETLSESHILIANGFVTSNCAQTPEHAKVGLTKHLTLIGSISIMSRDQYSILKDYLQKNTVNVLITPPLKLQEASTYKVFLNGDWLGVTDKFLELSQELRKMKLHGEFDHKNVSIVTDHDDGEIRVFCDSGRLYRPMFVVEDNKLTITKDHIKTISLNKADHLKKITDFDEFIIKNPGLIEYVDMELQPYISIADKQKKLNVMSHKMTNSIELSQHVKSRHVDNRYDDMFYEKYTHCEIHPSLLIGEIIANIPFFDHNVGPRVIFAYAQGRQAMGIYATNYRDRMDISYILYHPQRPLVSTRTARYTNSELLPAGENCVVAIACYTGYNQEDSLIFNKSSIERGKFRGMYLKKYLVQVQKNQTTLQDDIFMKPDINKVSNMKNGNVDKLNEKGYAPEETRLENGDVIFGKVTPITDPASKKPYKDSSEIYKMHTSAVVDRMYIDIPNADGYLTREALIRSEKVPKIGDKYSSRHGQKGTIGIMLDAIDMPFTKDGIVPDLIMNPNAVPSRMTIGQLVECLVGKCAAIQGMDADGTVFEEHDFEHAKDVLEKLGYERNGYEEMYNGMSGEKMKAQIFIGPTFYQRLKHLVEDKIHSRSRGAKTSLTRQAPEGRSREGGLRLGEMERDALLAHGLSKFIKEKLLDNSDAYTTFVCDKCGLFARRVDKDDNKTFATDDDTYYCPTCSNFSDISKVKIPYAFKLFLQEMMAMCVAPRIRCIKNIYNS